MRRTATLGLTLLLMAGGCTHVSQSEGSSYELNEFSISGPGRLAGSPGAVEVVNTGEYAHTLVVTTEMGEVVAATDLVMPGDTLTLDLDLGPGTYRFTCRIVAENDGQLIDHYEAGMNRVIEVISG